MIAHELRSHFLKTLTVLDGGLATSLEARGHDLSGTLWSARLLQDAPDELSAVNVSHAAAGADIISTASYQVSRQGYVSTGRTEEDADLAITCSVEITRAVADRIASETGRKVLVAGSLGPYGAVLADGSEYRGDYSISREDLTSFHRNRIAVMIAAAPDLLAFETVPSLMEVEVIDELLREEFTSIPAWISCSAKDGQRISDGTPAADAINALSADNIVAFGFNCIKPELAESLLAAVADYRHDLPRIIYTNAGRTWDAVNRCWLDEGTDHIDAATLERWVELGARIIGGCCGLGEAHVRGVAAFVAAAR